MKKLGYTGRWASWEVRGMCADVRVFPGKLCSTQGLEVLEPEGETGEHSRAGLELLDPSLPPGTASIINVPIAFHRWLLGRQRQGSGTCDVHLASAGP